MLPYLYKADVVCVLSEALTTHIQTVLSDQTVSVRANAAAKRTNTFTSHSCQLSLTSSHYTSYHPSVKLKYNKY
uniref:Uncharacterized protein n=1 Tax=Anguilla anguilla TaxID=7936 RepID=A0A0E9PVQ3_ANGAN